MFTLWLCLGSIQASREIETNSCNVLKPCRRGRRPSSAAQTHGGRHGGSSSGYGASPQDRGRSSSGGHRASSARQAQPSDAHSGHPPAVEAWLKAHEAAPVPSPASETRKGEAERPPSPVLGSAPEANSATEAEWRIREQVCLCPIRSSAHYCHAKKCISIPSFHCIHLTCFGCDLPWGSKGVGDEAQVGTAASEKLRDGVGGGSVCSSGQGGDA